MRLSQFPCLPLLPRVAGWLLPCLLVVEGCSSGERSAGPLPTGHYEGPVTYQGTEQRVVLDLREDATGRLEGDLQFANKEGLGFPAANLRYNAPMLHFERQAGAPDNMIVEAIREGDFWRGTLTTDSAQAELLLVRRGKADPRPYGTQGLTIRYGTQNMRSTLRLPDDTVRRHPAVVLLPDSATNLNQVADLLARQGFATLITQPAPTTPDSAAGQMAQAALATLRATPSVDTTHVGLWVTGKNAPRALALATRGKASPAFVVVQAVPVSSAEAQQPFRALARQRIPVLALYGGNDTTVDVRESSRRLRSALGGRAATVRVYPNANHNLALPGGTRADGKWEWSRPATGYVEDLLAWLRARL
ncbi:dienelactone hydrolase family protein [Hymenobacter cavernae]|uniref:Dienelactone hydrolase domain-containing protein n=1 Tax=Hymenobacter cavernae TaxID=2044852 RepID=A0ABQ1TL18_9BACT|nr:dienelactone hydrolase family protein [Hymenobacter cavernae]GGE97928.1 hypothetical protein GCM10011383_05880 [Hymenobacter cavernae]